MKHIKKYENYEFYNKTLCPTFWTDFKFNERIREKLLVIAHDFYNEIKIDAPIKDIVLVGSLANFNWTKYSDLDVHIIVDYKDVNEDTELVSKFFRDRKHVWDLHHNITIKDYEVELYIENSNPEDENQKLHSTAIYSLMNNTWISQPKYDEPKIDKNYVFNKSNIFIEKIKELEKISNTDLSPEDANAYYSYASKYKSKIMKMRQESLEAGGELSNGNLIYKVIRNFGYMNKLFDVIYKLYDKIYIQ